MYAACYRKGPLLSTHSEPGQRKDNLWYDVPQQCHQRSRSISSALVSGSHSLSGVSGSERNTADVQYRPSNLFILWRARALDSRNNFLVGLPERNTKWIQIRKCAQLTGRDNSRDDDDDEDDDEWGNDSALKLRLLIIISSITVRLRTLVGALCRKLQSIHQILGIVRDVILNPNHKITASHEFYLLCLCYFMVQLLVAVGADVDRREPLLWWWCKRLHHSQVISAPAHPNVHNDRHSDGGEEP